MKKTLTLLSSIILFSSSVTASPSKWTGLVDITELYPAAQGMVVRLDYSDKSVSTCDYGTRFLISSTSDNYSVKVSTLISAFMANKKINAAYDPDQDANCEAHINRFIVPR